MSPDAVDGLEIRLMRGMDDCEDLADLLADIWQVRDTSYIFAPHALRAIEFAGNYVAGALADGKLVAGAVAYCGPDGHLHSDVVGVAESMRGKGVGYAIKLHQRDWAIERGIDSIRWTFDPARLPNARFNLHRLGAKAIDYLPDFYGSMDDAFNTNVPTDRLLVDWRVNSPRVVTAITRGLPEPDGDPRVPPLPRAALREALLPLLRAGQVITGVTRGGHYVVEGP
ncbi:MAG TPA: GNAT family N-acetyltransferase [Stackebrandtia sp.]|jgi:predicted GNAT superfamily acetyltransferase|uniref:GNAT family N-acetyltransferase n=1 Tax=Stackebrandtia sp. TaxID=2023065 RepID=UPI002D3365EE|nr:GNAT family N-acetyltransferase [Stackebrandtia sp.]HZE41747.1 GNAT family N-acetyltransferase [Stackebrandtia sp.]